MKTEIERKPYCSCCSRRNFLKSFGTAIGAALLLPEELLAALPGPVNPATIPDKKGAVRVRLVLCTYGQKEISGIGWPHIGYDFRPFEKNVTDALNAGVKDVEFIPTKADDEADGEAIAMEDAKRGDIDGYLVIGMNCWNTAVLGIAKAGKPVLYTALPYGGDAGWLTNNSILRRNNQPAYEALSTFRFEDIVEMSGAFSKLKNGTADDYVKAARKWRLAHTPSKVRERAVEGHLDCLSVDDTLEAIRGMKMLSIEKDRQDRFKILKEDFGVESELVHFSELNEAWEKADETLARKVADKWKTEAISIENVITDETLFGCAKMYVGMKDLLAKHSAQAIAVDCLRGCYGGLIKSYPCLGFMQLQDEGYFGICEDDINSTFTMMLFTAMTKGRMGYVSDPVLDVPTRTISYAHCVSTRKFFGPEGKQYPFEILTHAEDHQGASVRAIAPVGYPVTTVKFQLEKKLLAVHTGIIIGNDPDDRACRTKILARVTGDFEKIYGEWDTLGWHRVTYIGDFADEVEQLADRIGYTLIKES